MKRETKQIGTTTKIETLEARRMFAAVVPADFCGPLPMTDTEIHTSNATPLLRTMGPEPVDFKAQAAAIATEHTNAGTPWLRFIGPLQNNSEAQPQDARTTPFVGPVRPASEVFGNTVVGPLPEFE